MSKLFRPLCGTLALVTVATTAGAQATPQAATIDVSARVSTQLANNVQQHLNFGTIFPGIAKAISPADVVAGRFELRGDQNAGISYSFELIDHLALPGTPPAATMPIGTWLTCSSTTSSASSCSPVSAAGSFTATLGGAGGTLYVFIGATVSPAADQADGLYGGKITMTAAYTGT
jgi:hypothetical protein